MEWVRRICADGLRAFDLAFDGDIRFTKVDFGKLIIFERKQIEQYGDRRPHVFTSTSCFSFIPSTQPKGTLVGLSAAQFSQCLTAVSEFMSFRK
jgi:hypothetical protein